MQNNMKNENRFVRAVIHSKRGIKTLAVNLQTNSKTLAYVDCTQEEYDKFSIGDQILVIQTKPLSKKKRYKVVGGSK